VQHMADLAIELATKGSKTRQFHWNALFAGRGPAKARGRGARAKQ